MTTYHAGQVVDIAFSNGDTIKGMLVERAEAENMLYIHIAGNHVPFAYSNVEVAGFADATITVTSREPMTTGSVVEDGAVIYIRTAGSPAWMPITGDPAVAWSSMVDPVLLYEAP